MIKSSTDIAQPRAPRHARRAAAAHGVRITDTDLALLSLLARYTVVTVPILMRHVQSCEHRSAVYRRIARLVDAGYVEDLRSGPANRVRQACMPALVKATKAGYALSGAALAPVKRLSPGTLEHTLVVAEIGLMLESEGKRVLTDREIRSQIAQRRIRGGATAPSDAVWIDLGARRESGDGSRSRRPRTHAPDLVYWTATGMVAVEVEWSVKSDQAMADVVRAYGSTTQYKGVVYVVRSEEVIRKFEKAMRAVSSNERPSPALFHFVCHEPQHSVYPEKLNVAHEVSRPGLPTQRPVAGEEATLGQE